MILAMLLVLFVGILIGYEMGWFQGYRDRGDKKKKWYLEV